MDTVLAKIDNNKKSLSFAFITTFIWGMVSHSYGFLHSNFSHDSLNEFNGAYFGNTFKVELGRFMVPLYRAIFRSDITLPWLIGVLSLLWIALAVFLVIKIFNIESRTTAFLVPGIFTANITVTAMTATYLHDLDCDMFGLLMAVMAVYCWKNVHKGVAFGAILVAISLGVYQSYISVTIALVMFVCILDLLNKATFKSVFLKGLKAILMIFLGGAIYYILMNLTSVISDITLSSGNYNSVDRMLVLTIQSIPGLIFGAYKDFCYRFICVVTPYPDLLVKAISVILVLAAGVPVISGLLDKEIKPAEKCLCVLLLLLLPLGMNITYILVMGDTHDLMAFAIWLFYLLILLLMDWLVKTIKLRKKESRYKGTPNIVRLISVLLISVLLYGNVQTANVLYLKKDLEQDAFLSLMTRVVYRIEDCDEYIPGTTKVVIAGLPEQLNDGIPGFEKYQRVTGAWSTYVPQVATPSRYQAYVDFIQLNPMIMAEETIWEAMLRDQRVIEMPGYPSDGCLAMIDDVLVVKLGNKFD